LAPFDDRVIGGFKLRRMNARSSTSILIPSSISKRVRLTFLVGMLEDVLLELISMIRSSIKPDADALGNWVGG
jgi:hypothetical protein